jgi:hypothetical protein
MNVSAAKNQAVQSAPPIKRVEGVAHEASKPKEPTANNTRQTKTEPVVNTSGQSTGRLLNVTA